MPWIGIMILSTLFIADMIIIFKSHKPSMFGLFIQIVALFLFVIATGYLVSLNTYID